MRSCRISTGYRPCWPPRVMPDIKEKLLAGYKAGDMTYKVHLDGYNFLPYLTGRKQRRRASNTSTFPMTAI